MKHRMAYTLLEIIVVIAIIAILIGLTLGAVQKARHAANKATCQSKLRQIGIALHAYHEVHGELPPGVSFNNGRDPMPFLSWNCRILPYLEQSSVWSDTQSAFAENSRFLYNPPHKWLREFMPAYVCPSDSNSQSFARTAAFTDYLGVEGTNQVKKDGVLFLDSRVKFTDIFDGTSNTIMVGERPPPSRGNLGWWYAGEGQEQDGSAEMVLGAREVNTLFNPPEFMPGCGTGPFTFQAGKQNNDCDALHFWSLHSGGCNFLFADGSVSFRSYSIDPILPALCTRSGNEVFEDS